MACASQSALDYVKRARDHLVRTLEGLTEIVENLNQKGIFSDEEVSKIKTEGDGLDKTTIVDFVIKKGEAACYEFLRIIDTTRKKSGETLPSFLENAALTSPLHNTFDLNSWISCFSFKEDMNMDVTYLQDPEPCHKYQLKLKSKAQKLSERSWTQSKAVLFNKAKPLSYISLVLNTQGQVSPSKVKKSKIKKSRKLRPKKLKTYIPENKQGSSPDELLKSYEKNILLVGKPGVGKTAVVHQMLKLWSEKDNKDLDYMFYFDMRETPTITEVRKLEDLLFGKFSEPDEGKDEVLEDIKKNADSVTIIFDGVTDVPSPSVVLELIEKTLLPEAKIIITCRPEAESADFLLDWDCLRVEVKGFSEQSIREYLSKNLSEEHLNQVLCNLELFTLCHVPMYALMVVASFSFEGSDFSPHPCTVTEIYLNILHFCIQRNDCKTSENERSQRSAILSLAEAAFCAIEGKTVNLKSLPQLDRCVHLTFLNMLQIQVGPTVKKPLCAFLHYTVQEFFAALWVLKDPERTRGVLHQCLVEGTNHMKHLVPFLCGLLNEKNNGLLESLIPSQQLRNTSGWFFKDLVNTFVDPSEVCEIDLLFLCQCLYESQSAEACLCLLGELDYCVHLSGEILDPQHCCAVSYVISHSEERKIQLNLENATVSKPGMRSLLGCLNKLQRSDSLSRQLWTVCLLSEGEVDYRSLLCFDENQLHLPVNSNTQLYDRAVKVLQKSAEKVKVCLHWDWRVCQSVSEVLLQCLSNIHSLSFCQSSGNLSDQTEFLMNLFIGAAEREQQTGEKMLKMLSSVCSHPTFNVYSYSTTNSDKKYRLDFLLDLYSRVKDYETQTGRSLLPSLQSVFQSAPAVWSIKLSERKTSILLEVLKLQSEKKPVELIGCSDEESEVRSFLQCVPYISQLSFCWSGNLSDQTEFLMNLFIGAAEREQQTGEKILKKLSSVCSHPAFLLCDDDYDYDDYHLDFLLDLFSRVKDYETQTGRSLLPSLQSVFQSAPAVWSIDLSERKTSILLEVLKLQSEKKPVELIECSDEESEVRSFLQCVPYISQLSFFPWSENLSDQTKFLMNLFIGAAEREQQTGEKILKKLSSVCSYKEFPLQNDYNHSYQSDFLLDLYSRVKDYETQTGRSLLPSLQSVFQSAPAVWSIKLSEIKTSILLEVLKLQSEKKPVELIECSDEESEVRSFLQCVPYISQLSFCRSSGNLSDQTEFLMNLFIGAAEREQQTGEKMLNMLSSVCSYKKFPLQNDSYHSYQSDFLLDLFSRVKDYETQTGRSLLPSLQSVFQSAPAVWSIKLSEIKTSILLEVLKLQSEKKPVELIGCSDEESEVRSFLQCVPYISQLSFCRSSGNLSDQTEFLMNLFIGAAEREQQTGEKMLNMLSSVCSYKKFPLQNDSYHSYQSDFLLDLFSRVKDYETQTGRSLLPSLQSVFQSAPAVWSIKLSEIKTSILLEVLKLQSEKKPVQLIGCSDEESEVRSFLQCVPYISQLSFCRSSGNLSDQTEFLMNLFIGAAEREQQTGEKMLNMLSSVCSYKKFPFQNDYNHSYQSDFLLDLYSRVKDYETQTGRSLLPSLQSVFQSAPAVWSIKLSEIKTSILLEVLKLQSEKKPVQLIGCSDEESEVRSFLQCVPYISQLRFCPWWSSKNLSAQTKFLMNLFIGAAEREQQTGEKMLNMLSSVCSYKKFPLQNDSYHSYQSDFLLDLYSRVKDYETQTGRSLLPSLQSVFQSAPAVWSIKLSEIKTSILLEVLKLQSEKKPVELIGCSDEESEVRSFLQCVPYISQLSCDPGFCQRVCTSFAVKSEQEVQQMSSLLQLLDFNLLLTGWLSSKTCTSVGRVLGLCGSKVNLSLTCRRISARGASLLFKHTSHLKSLRLSTDLVLLLLQWVRTGEVSPSLIIEELRVIESMTYELETVLLSVVSSVASLLRFWTVRQLDLMELCIPTQHLTALLHHQGSLTIKVNKENLQQLLAHLHEIQDQELTQCFLSKVGGDLTSCCLDWEVLCFLLQHSSGQTITVNQTTISSLEENFSHLLPVLDRIVFKRSSPSFVLSAIRHIHEAHSSHSVPYFLRSLDHEISLTCKELDSVDLSALLFLLHHSDGVKLNLLWTSIPAENMESLIFTLDKVSQLSVDRTLLLRLVHCCAAAQQRASSILLGALQHRLDLSCSSFMDLEEEKQRETLRLTAADCWAISTILGYSSQETQLDLRDCEVEENGLDMLLPVLGRVRLRVSKAVLLQLVSLIPQHTQRDSVRWAESLWRALDGELDLSHTTLDQRTCSSLAQVLDSSEGLTELDLSYCQLTDQLLYILIPQMHKVKVLDLSHNKLTDVSTNMLLSLTSIRSSIHTVRVFGNDIENRRPFTDKRFEIW